MKDVMVETRPRLEQYRIVMKDVMERKYGVMGFGRHAGFTFKLKIVIHSRPLHETERVALWSMMMEWVPLVEVLQGVVPFDGIGGLGEGWSVGELDTAGWQGRLIRFEWLKIVDYKGLVRLTDANEE